MSRDIQWLNSFCKEYKKRKDDSKKLVDEFYSHDEDDQTPEESEPEELKGNENKCIWICYLFLWNTNCLEKQRNEKCCTINH